MGIRLRTTVAGARAVLSVDDSAGTETSERLRVALQEGVRGGLGLRVVRSLAAAMHADVNVAATVDGSSVQIGLVRVQMADATSRGLVSP